MILPVAGNLEAALRQLRKRLERDGTFYAMRRQAFFRPRSERRRLKARRARKRARRALVGGTP
ncbi:MAG: 30S ribosomal protein S21 [Candidatus Rokubacteria bacterium]|nr:30S ribosomal protein S21 [Candidatus Rokubacteria bacterium]MBI3109296.1 30S ribosomal protein S21 [Candidatus Rokubacteria bacterium]